MLRKFEWTKEDLRTLPNSKDEAIAEGGRYYFTGSLCRYGHLCPRFQQKKVKTRTATFYKKIRSSVLIFTDEPGGGESE